MGRKLMAKVALAVAAAMILAAGTLIEFSGTASANSCAAACHAAHSQCRIATKGSPSCDAQLSSCLRSCAGRK